MILSGLFNIAAHPDLIKIFSVEQFHIWLAKPQSQALVGRGLAALKRMTEALGDFFLHYLGNAQNLPQIPAPPDLTPQPPKPAPEPAAQPGPKPKKRRPG